MENLNNLEEKQQYLRDEIMDKSYDVDEFSEFMSKYKENGTDLENWEFIELKDAVKIFKNKVKEEEENKIEKGVEKIRKSYVFNESQNKENDDEYLDINLQLNNKNENQNCVNNILNDYMKNQEKVKEKNKIKEIKNKQNKKEQNLNNNNNNINNYPNLHNKIIQNQENNINQNQNNCINNNIKENINNNFDNNKIYLDNQNKQKEFADFEILEDKNINNKVIEKIQCVKQSENSLTKKNNLYINLEA